MRPRWHFVALLLPLLCVTRVIAAPHQAQSAGSFVDSIGVNTHYTNSAFKESPYGKLALDQKLGALGIRHIRDNPETPQGFARVAQLRTKYGISAILVPNGTEKPVTALVSWLKQYPAYEAIEGLNEPDIHARTFNGQTDVNKGDDLQFPGTRAFQEALYKAVKADPRTKNIPVLSPAMAHVVKQHFLDGVAFDVGSMHSYPFGREPAVAVGNRLDQMREMKTPQGELREIWITETGYYNRPANGRQASEAATAKYIPRLLALAFARGVARTYIYELIDQGDDLNNREMNFGLLRFDLAEKPTYVALKGLTTLLKDPTAKKSSQPATLDVDVTSAAGESSIEHLLLQKSDGRFYLLIWNEVPSWDPKAGTEVTPQPIAAKIKFARPFASAKVIAIGDGKERATAANAAEMNLQIGDEVLAVEITPVK